MRVWWQKRGNAHIDILPLGVVGAAAKRVSEELARGRARSPCSLTTVEAATEASDAETDDEEAEHREEVSSPPNWRSGSSRGLEEEPGSPFRTERAPSLAQSLSRHPRPIFFSSTHKSASIEVRDAPPFFLSSSSSSKKETRDRARAGERDTGSKTERV